MKLKVFFNSGLILILIGVVSAQNRYGNQRASTNRNRYSKNEPVEQGRTLGLLGPLVGLGINRLTRPYAGLGFDPIVPAGTYRPGSSSSTSAQADPYYGGYNGYGGYPSNYYGGYNYYPNYRPYYPPYLAPFFGGYRPLAYPNYYGGYPQYNNYASQRPLYSNQRPTSPIAQPPSFAQQPGLNNLAAIPARPSTSTPIAGSGSTSPQINSAQAAQVANLLGQLLGSQLRPLLGQGTAAAAHDTAYNSSSSIEDKRYKTRNFN